MSARASRIVVLVVAASVVAGCGSDDRSHAVGPPTEVGGFHDAARLSDGSLAAVGFSGLDASQRSLVVLLDADGAPRFSSGFAPVRSSGRVESRGDANAVAVTADDVIVAAGRIEGDDDVTQGVVAAFAPSGERLWQTLVRPGDSHEVVAVAVDGDAAYVAGSARDVPRVDGEPGDAERGVLVARLDVRSGEVAWVDLAARAADPLESTTAFAVDASADGRVAVAGAAATASSSVDWFVGTWSADGTPLWSDLADGSGETGSAGGGDFDVARKLRFDATGDLFVVGDTMEAGEGSNIQVVRYAADGRRRWTRRSGSVPTETFASLDRGTALAVANDGVWIGGTVERAGDGTVIPEASIQRFDGAGTLLASLEIHGLSQSGEDVADVAVAADGESLVAGSLSSRGAGKDLVVHRTDADGQPRWTATVERTGDDSLDGDHAARVLVAPDDTVYSVGSLALADGTPGWAAVALDGDGRLRWSYPTGSVTQTSAR